MKQGILITAYKNLDHLLEIVNSFDDDFEFYIHIDRKTTIPDTNNSELNSNPRIKMISQRFNVNWGGRNHLKSILLLISEAIKNKEIGYFHLITGQDFPMKSPEKFKDHFTNDKEVDYLENFSMPASCWKNGGMDRIQYFNFFDVFNAKKGLSLINKLVQFQKKLKIKRPISKNLPKLYGGSTYWSLTRSTLYYVIQYHYEYRQLFKRMKYTFCPEEIYIQTIVMNSIYSKKVISDNLRFIVWEERHGSIPGILDENDWESISRSNAYFARKFDYPISNRLIEKLKSIMQNH